MKKKSYLIVLSVIVMLAALAWFREPIRAGVGAFALNNQEAKPVNQNGAVLSTSTLNYLTPGTGTTTIVLYTGGADQTDIDIFMVASSTLTDLRWRFEFSHSSTSVAATQLWYPEVMDLSSTGTTTNQVQISKEYRWLFASSTKHRIGTSTAMNGTFDQNTTGSRRISVKDLAARWTRVIFYIPTGSRTSNFLTTALGDTPAATSTNAGIYIQPVAKEPL